MKLAIELRSLVHESVSILGEVIRRQLGEKAYQQIESLREEMTDLRHKSVKVSFETLQKRLRQFEKLKPSERDQIAHAFTLMLEVMNAAENAYRSFRLSLRDDTVLTSPFPDSITYVLTAHPTEARSPQNIAIFHQIQNQLLEILQTSKPGEKVTVSREQREDLFHWLEIAWRTPVVRQRSPKVKDEADSIYAQVFRDDVIFSLIEANGEQVPFHLHSWVGGDKDGHPGVDDIVLMQSLGLSRGSIVKLVQRLLGEIRGTLDLLPSSKLIADLAKTHKSLNVLKILKAGDFARVEKFSQSLNGFQKNYLSEFGQAHPSLRKIQQLLNLFPGMVIPLELRESSDVIMAKAPKGKPFAIDRMLQKIAKLAGSSDPRMYARSFIISMTESALHLHTACLKQKAVFGNVRLPVVPLFEEAVSLAGADQIMREALKDPLYKNALEKFWQSKVEMMVGYSDSSKEAGVLPSRLAIAEALPRLEKVCQQAGYKAIFFHGSGGSVDRGGGRIDEQTAWWPRSALVNYKVTVQGEMVERSVASPMIAERQLKKIAQSSSVVLKNPSHEVQSETLNLFAKKISKIYGESITSPQLLDIVQAATPYSFMSYLKIGSRPAKRTQELAVKALRAIPWIMCWTQTRLLFPIWWGVGQAWSEMSEAQKKDLQKAYREEPVFTSYMKALDFTLAKVELAIFFIYLHESSLSRDVILTFQNQVEQEHKKAVEFCQTIMGSKELLGSKEWLKESVQLRSPMIHPLNLLQILAQKNHEIPLLRLTVTGISSGMMSTG